MIFITFTLEIGIKGVELRSEYLQVLKIYLHLLEYIFERVDDLHVVVESQKANAMSPSSCDKFERFIREIIKISVDTILTEKQMELITFFFWCYVSCIFERRRRKFSVYSNNRAVELRRFISVSNSAEFPFLKTHI